MNARALGVLALLGLAVVLGLSPQGASAEGPLTVAVIGDADSAAFPEVAVNVSVVEQQTGKPATALKPESFILSDESGAVPILRVEESVASVLEARTAYVLAIDNGAALARDPARLQRVRDFALAVVANLGSNDTIQLVLFNAGVDSEVTTWVHRTDPTLNSRLQGLAAVDLPTNLQAALQRTSEISRDAPLGYDRRAVIMIAPRDDESLTPALDDAAIHALGVRYFLFTSGVFAQNSRLSAFYDSLERLSDGGHWSLDDPTQLQEATRRAFELSQRTWRLVFDASALPDGAVHTATMLVQDGGGTGSAQFNYRSGRLYAVTQPVFLNLALDERISEDRDIQVALEGREWPSYTIELFHDCVPGDDCSPVARSENRALEYRLGVGGLDQGAHEFLVRVTAFDTAGRQFSDTASTLRYERRGTTFNLPAMFLVGGAAVLAVVIAAILMWRKRVGSGRSWPGPMPGGSTRPG